MHVGGGMRGGGHTWQGSVRAGETATEACGTNPTGMHSCICIDLQKSTITLPTQIILLRRSVKFKTADLSHLNTNLQLSP